MSSCPRIWSRLGALGGSEFVDGIELVNWSLLEKFAQVRSNIPSPNTPNVEALAEPLSGQRFHEKLMSSG
jgi:hypothetical protein